MRLVEWKLILSKRNATVAATEWLAKAQRYLRSAELLIRDSDYESAVSRAYYGVFHAAKALLMVYDRQVLNMGAREDRRYTWFQAIRLLRKTRDLNRSLTTLHARREDADYEVAEITSAMAPESLIFARAFINRTEERIRERESQTRR